MSTKIGINGFGRTGRQLLRAIQDTYRDKLEVVGISNRRVAAEDYAHLFKYDTTYGAYQGEVSATEDSMTVDGSTIQMVSASDIADLPWGDLGADIVVDSTGAYTDAQKAAGHLEAGAKKVVITAPAKNEDVTVVLGVNEKDYDADRHNVISGSSCTTGCIATMAKVLHENFEIEQAFMTTVHSYTGDQRLLDGWHRDRRRARSAASNIVPTSTGAAKSVGIVIPDLLGKLDGMALRVPTDTVSMTDLVATLGTAVSIDEVNQAYKTAAGGDLKGIMEYTEEELVSSDFRGNPHSCIIDAGLTKIMGGNMVKVQGWYDNEWGYSCRTADLCAYVADQGV
ncbi:MAG: type I glyceraldehyde-3-phosphate dehydrogenase [SAR202 cluster bacterium]|jgi:glyceraldehyde 3-phosphate dehydrogenase|nr:type I glyceraldehyde-3-phosphate dehydrogenase [SAR202 cluster bacterium]MDP6714408.1 type I glyceraldehyde-3-phosphate dehydrogenase [SAR202 cluster bacterium]